MPCFVPLSVVLFILCTMFFFLLKFPSLLDSVLVTFLSFHVFFFTVSIRYRFVSFLVKTVFVPFRLFLHAMIHGLFARCLSRFSSSSFRSWCWTSLGSSSTNEARWWSSELVDSDPITRSPIEKVWVTVPIKIPTTNRLVAYEKKVFNLMFVNRWYKYCCCYSRLDVSQRDFSNSTSKTIKYWGNKQTITSPRWTSRKRGDEVTSKIFIP